MTIFPTPFSSNQEPRTGKSAEMVISSLPSTDMLQKENVVLKTATLMPLMPLSVKHLIPQLETAMDHVKTKLSTSLDATTFLFIAMPKIPIS